MNPDHEPSDGENAGLGFVVLALCLLSLLARAASCLPKDDPMPTPRRTLAALVPPLGLLALVGLFVACTPGQRQEAKTVVQLANGACLLLVDVPELAPECATLREIEPYITEFLAKKRAAARASASASASAAPAGSAR